MARTKNHELAETVGTLEHVTKWVGGRTTHLPLKHTTARIPLINGDFVAQQEAQRGIKLTGRISEPKAKILSHL